MQPLPRTEYEFLSSTDAARVDKACDRFEVAWKAVAFRGDRPTIPPFCAEFGEPERTVLVWELIALDRAYRTGRGEIPRAEDYQGLCAEYDSQLPPGEPTRTIVAENHRAPIGPWPE